jgi:hypothetical protein
MFSMTAIILSFTWPVYNDELVVYLSNYGAPGVTWTEQGTGQYSPVAPSLAALNGRLYMAFRSNDPTNRLLVMSSSDGKTWTGGTATGQTSPTTPALALDSSNGYLYMAFQSNDPTNRLLVMSSSDGKTWTGGTPSGQTSQDGPALASFNGRLYMAFRSNDPTNRLLVVSSSDNGGHWTGGQLANLTTVVAPALAVGPGPNGELLYLAFTQPPQEGGDASSIEVVATDGVEWTEPLYTQATYQALTPALGAF